MSKQLSLTIKIVLLSLIISGCSKSDNTPETQVSAGELIVKQNCKVCHAQGINGAPIIGNKKMWGPRISKGIPTLVQHATNGFGLMPPKGGNNDLNNEQITQAVTYMVGKVQQ